MDLDQIAGEPDYSAPIAGKTYRFGELTLAAHAKLQAWIRKHVPNPIEAVKPHLDGLPAEDRASLLDGARREALHWPPKVGTAAAAQALLGTEEGQVELLFHALSAHQPETTPAEALRLYRAMKKESVAHNRREQAAAKREGREPREYDVIVRVVCSAFGMEPDGDGADGRDAPKAG